MRLCLCLCASENSIRQISGFVLLLMLMLMSRVFSLAYACAYAYALVRTSLYESPCTDHWNYRTRSRIPFLEIKNSFQKLNQTYKFWKSVTRYRNQMDKTKIINTNDSFSDAARTPYRSLPTNSLRDVAVYLNKT